MTTLVLTATAGPADSAAPAAGPGAGSAWHQPLKQAPARVGVFDHDVAMGDRVAAIAWAGTRGVRVRLRVPGTDWHQKVRLDGRGSRSPSVAVNDRGDVAVAWTREGRNHTRLRVSRRTAGGQWNGPTTLAVGTPAFGTDGPEVSVGPRGKVSVGLSYARRGGWQPRPRVFTFLDGRWGGPATLARRGGNGLRLVTGPRGRVTAAWVNDSGARCVANGANRTWSPARCWARPWAGVPLDLAVDDQGRVYLMSYHGVWSRAPGGEMRREPVPYGRHDAFGGDNSFSLDASAPGRAAVVWSSGRQTGRASVAWRTFASVRSPDGSWSPRAQLSREPAASVAVSDVGTTTVAWPARDGIQVVRKLDGQPWSDRRTVVGKPMSSAPYLDVNASDDVMLLFTRRFDTSHASLWTAWRP
ncbi:hypothetical protein [Nocardioides coralli]|uniref:hypothetical protein n=1 Tax=Nocardioides coralli TaxID=2872154 RepID=UPI001CA41F50|nr:hypothetical protein [Nocardioides coralli]QZY29706.1 hypothetical protein K6T13_03155 [Nocardioides coralli]